MTEKEFRIEHDSMGEVRVPVDAKWGPQTQRAVENFPISGIRMPRAFLHGLGLVKWSAAAANESLGLLDKNISKATRQAADQVAAGDHDAEFPVDVFQTGSGTTSNMNANEVIGRLASETLGQPVHPNDHVNMSQSSNDVIPTVIHVSTAIELHRQLLPALDMLHEALTKKAGELEGIVKTGRTHLMDAMPVRLDQVISGWASQVRFGRERIESSLPRLLAVAQGGTAVGTGINAHERFGAEFTKALSKKTGLKFRIADDYFERLGSQDTAVEVSGQLRVIAVGLMKIANDLRWMNSGPLAGLGEISLPALQPGSSIMPGKVNPVIPEAVAMVAAHVIGNDTAITVGGQAGNFELNVMLPMIAYNLLQSIGVLSGATRVLAEKCIAGFTVNEDNLKQTLERNPILVTALNPLIGYERGAAIAKKAYAEGRAIRDVAREMTDLSDADLDRLLDPAALTKGGIRK